MKLLLIIGIGVLGIIGTFVIMLFAKKKMINDLIFENTQLIISNIMLKVKKKKVKKK